MAIGLSASVTSSSSSVDAEIQATVNTEENFQRGAVLNIDFAGDARPANAVRATGRAYPRAVALEARTNSNTEVDIQFTGNIPVLFETPPPSFRVGDPVYLSTTDGSATLTRPNTSGTVVIQLGTLYSADGVSGVATVKFDPEVVGWNG